MPLTIQTIEELEKAKNVATPFPLECHWKMDEFDDDGDPYGRISCIREADYWFFTNVLYNAPSLLAAAKWALERGYKPE